MMISRRTTLSLVQYLALQECSSVGLLCEKHCLSWAARVSDPEAHGTNFLTALNVSFADAPQDTLLAILDEVLRTKRYLRSRATPKFSHDERFADLEKCLFLDGFVVQGDRLIPLDPTILKVPPVEDDLTQALQDSGLPEADAILLQFEKSATAFRATSPNFNACLNDARVALQTLAGAIATTRLLNHSGNFDNTKWESILQYLRASGFISKEEEEGLAGVFRFVSPGSHKPVGLSQREMARLGRSFIAGMCWFMIKRFMEENALKP